MSSIYAHFYLLFFPEKKTKKQGSFRFPAPFYFLWHVPLMAQFLQEQPQELLPFFLPRILPVITASTTATKAAKTNQLRHSITITSYLRKGASLYLFLRKSR